MGLFDRDFTLASGERLVELQIDRLPPDAVARYRFACEVLADLPGPLVGADIFCGNGYGTHLLAQSLPCFIQGIDGSAESIDLANSSYVDFNVLYSQKFFPFSLLANHFDFIVSVESVEHVEQGEAFFGLMVHALKPGGRLIISAPNSQVVDQAKNPNPWHYKHYSVEEVLNLGEQHGLTLMTWLGANCTLINPSGMVVSGNDYSPHSGALVAGRIGDTQTYYFQKPVSPA